jgi:hemoglobin
MQTAATPYELLGGEAGVRRLAATFYDVMNELPAAAAIRRMHADDLTAIKETLFEYLSGWLGGPHIYLQKRGSFCLSRPHAPYAIGPAERDQWLLCMREALRRIDASAELQAMLEQPLFRIAETIRNRDGAEAGHADAGRSCPG